MKGNFSTKKKLAQAGFTLVELVVAMFLMLGVIGGAFYVYNKLFSSTSDETRATGALMDRLVGAEILRLDLEHAGLGTDDGCSIDWDTTNKILTIKSRLNNTDLDTIGWVLAKCSASNKMDIVVDERSDTTTDLYFSDESGQEHHTDSSGNFISATSCTVGDYYLGYPGEIKSVTYSLTGQLSELTTCPEGARVNLKREISGTSTPIYTCVADWDVRFGIDEDGDGSADSITDTLSLDCDKRAVATRFVTIYLLVKAGGFDPSYDFGSDSVTIDVGSNPGDKDVTLAFPSACTTCRQYRWQVIEKTVLLRNMLYRN